MSSDAGTVGTADGGGGTKVSFCDWLNDRVIIIAATYCTVVGSHGSGSLLCSTVSLVSGGCMKGALACISYTVVQYRTVTALCCMREPSILYNHGTGHFRHRYSAPTCTSTSTVYTAGANAVRPSGWAGLELGLRRPQVKHAGLERGSPAGLSRTCTDC